MNENLAYQSRFSKISDIMDSKYLFYDFELKSIFNCVKECWNTLQHIKKRFDRKETVRISKTQTEFMQLISDSVRFPYVLYSFQHKSVTVAIVQHKKVYYVYIDGFCPSSRFVRAPIEIGKNLFNPVSSLDASIVLFREVVYHYLESRIQERLPF